MHFHLCHTFIFCASLTGGFYENGLVYESRMPKEFRENVHKLQRESMHSLYGNSGIATNSASAGAKGFKGVKDERLQEEGKDQPGQNSNGIKASQDSLGVHSWKRGNPLKGGQSVPTETSLKASASSGALLSSGAGKMQSKKKVPSLADAAKKVIHTPFGADKQLLSQKQTCSQTLRDLSSNPDLANIEMMARSGGIESIVELSKIDDEVTLTNCAVSLLNMAKRDTLHQKLIDGGALKAVGRIWLSRNAELATRKICANTLAELTCCSDERYTLFCCR
jgi:hypothetical protein